MNNAELKERVLARDRLLLQADNLGQQLDTELLTALRDGELLAAAAAARDHQAQLSELNENLRIYQAELHAQADELATSQARITDSLERFTALFSSLPVAVLLVARNGEVLDCNLQASSLFQLRPQAVIARFLHRLMDPDHFQASVRPAFLQAEAAGSSRVESLTFKTEAGRLFVGELHIARMPGRSDGDCSFACAVMDRTEQLESMRALQDSSAALRQSEASLAVAARVARTGGWELKLQPRALSWSAQLRELLDLPKTVEATLETLLGLCSVGDRAVLASALAKAELGEPFEIELDMHNTLGRPLRVLAVGRAEQVGTRVVRIYGMLQDITQQHLVRRMLGDLSERLSIANEAGGIGVWDCNLADSSVVFDQRMCQILGLTGKPEGGLVEALSAHLLPGGRERLQQALAAALTRLDPINLELSVRAPAGAPEGHEYWLHLSGRAHSDAQGRAVRLVGCAWDSSLQHETMRLRADKEAAESASRAKSAFLSRMSHELRTPLNAILGFSQLMRLEADAGDLVLKPHRVVLIESAARHLLELVNEVLDVSSIEAGRMEVQLAEVDLGTVLNEALPMVLGAAEKHAVTVALDLPAELPVRVTADRLRLRAVMINLLSNAVKYNRPGGSVQVQVALESTQAVVRVVDTGRGLDAQQVDSLFQPFNRAGAERTGIEGSGMGLFVSQRFVELMGGRIEVASQPGVGSTFSVHLHTAPC